MNYKNKFIGNLNYLNEKYNTNYFFNELTPKCIWITINKIEVICCDSYKHAIMALTHLENLRYKGFLILEK